MLSSFKPAQALCCTVVVETDELDESGKIGVPVSPGWLEAG
jgi:hypothetical protein